MNPEIIRQTIEILEHSEAEARDPHFSSTWLIRYLSGHATPDQAREVEEHTAACPQCQAELARCRESVAAVDADTGMKDRIWSRIQARRAEWDPSFARTTTATAPDPATKPQSLTALFSFLAALTQRSADTAEATVAGLAEAVAALDRIITHGLGAVRPATAGAAVRSSGSAPEPAHLPTDLREQITRHLTDYTQGKARNLTLSCGPFALQLRLTPGELPCFLAKPQDALEWQPFALIARSADGYPLARLDSDGTFLPLDRFSALPPDYDSLTLELADPAIA